MINKFIKRQIFISFVSISVLASTAILAVSGCVFFLSSCSAAAFQHPESGASGNTSVAENSSVSTTDPSAPAEALPDYSGYINDYTGTLSSEWKNKSEELVQKVQTDTGCEIAVAVIENLDRLTIEEYALNLFEKWGIGKKTEDNGVLLLISISDRQLRIEVGYGLEAVITDLQAREIIDNIIVPRFKLNDYNTGVYNGIAAIANIIYDEQGSGNLKVKSAAAEVKKSFVDTVWFPLIIVFANLLPWLSIGAVAFAAFLKSYIKEHRCPQCKKIGLVITRKWLLYPAYDYPGRQEVTKKCRYCSYYDNRTVSVARLSRTYGSGSSSSSSSGFSSGSSSSHSSSSSSFGGGSSGGGGASGHW